MTKTWTTLALTAVAVAGLSTRTWAEDDARARKLMEEAYNRRYRWDEGFKGFSADFRLLFDGKIAKGSIRVDATKSHGGVTVLDGPDVAKKLVSDVIGSTITHTRGSSFEKSFGSTEFTIAGAGAHGGTRIALEGHAFFKDFTVKDGTIIENHGGHGEMSSEVKVQQVVWVADTGKLLPRAYSFSIKNGDNEQSGKNLETWTEVDGVWLPTSWQLWRNEGSSAPVERTLTLENIKIERATR
jgi:hypothetical protein